MAVFSNHVFCVLVVAFLYGFLSVNSSKWSEKNLDKREKSRNSFIFRTSPITTTTSAPVGITIPCKMRQNMSNIILSQDIKQEIYLLIDQYNNWGKLLAPAPVVIGILGQMILTAKQVKDFPINRDDPEKTFQYIKYPESFRATLLQISQQGYRCFLKAHSNMNAIRAHNSALPSDIKDAVKYLTSNNTHIIKLRLPATLTRIKETAKKSQVLSKEVIDVFSLTLSLINETEQAAQSTNRGADSRLQNAIFDIQLQKQNREISEKEQMILKEKDAKMKEMMDRLEHRKGHLYSTTTYGDVRFTINLANNWVNEIGQDRYNKDKKYLHDENKTWKYIYYNKFINGNLCAQKSSQQLLDLIIAFGEYRMKYEQWQKSYNQNSIFDGSKFITNVEAIIGNIQQCPDVTSIISKGSDLINKLKNTNTFQSKTRELPCSKEINEITTLVNNLRTAANNVTESNVEQEEIVSKSAWDIYFVSKTHQLNQLYSMSRTVEDIVKLNNDLMEIRRQKTQEITNRIFNLNIIKVNIEEVIHVLKDGLNELKKLKDEWEKLILFFKNIEVFIKEASYYSTVLVEILETITSVQSKETEKMLFKDLLDNLKQSNEAVLLVHGVADNYVQVSDRYIMVRMIHLNTMSSMFGGATDKELEQEKIKLSEDAQQASVGIEEYFIQQTRQLNETLKKRNQDIFKEYEELLSCLADNGLTDRVINFTGDYWFQLKSRLDDLVLEIPTENSSIVHLWKSHGKDNQLWYFDQDKIIRSFATDDCLTSYYPAPVTVEPCKNTRNQKWTLKNKVIVNVENPIRCLNIKKFDKYNNTRIVETSCQRGTNQIWDVINWQTNDSPSDFRFLLKSWLNGKVLGVSIKLDPNVRMWDSLDKNYELWYLDDDKILRSYATDGCLTSHGDYPALVTVEPCQNTINQRWTIKDKAIINFENPNRCLNIRHSDKRNGALIVEYRCHRGRNQLWDIIH